MGLSYTSVRFVEIKDSRLAIAYYILTGLLLLYVVGFSIILDKGYQAYDPVTGTVSIKVQGAARSNTTGVIHDAHDLVRPPTEQNALFLTTSMVYTPEQSRGNCTDPESAYCVPGNCTEEFTNDGWRTGECRDNRCVIETWCEFEDDSDDNREYFDQVNEWSVFFKANILFSTFDYTFVNGQDITNNLNQFFTHQFLSRAEPGGFSFDDVKTNGAIILVTMFYDCDLNGGGECPPTFKFSRIDEYLPGRFSPGFNYRYVDFKNSFDVETNVTSLTRSLTKAYGIRLVFQLAGRAGQFSLTALTVTLGAGVALLSISSLVCDVLLQYVMPQRDLYAAQKFNVVEPAGDQAHLLGGGGSTST